MKEKAISPELAMRELIQKRKAAELHSQAANARNATNDPDKSHAHVVGHLENRVAPHEDHYQPPF